MRSSKITGSCLCRAVRYRFEGPIHVFQYCHCSRCRKFTGSAYASNIILDPEQFTWLGGEESVGRFELLSNNFFYGMSMGFKLSSMQDMTNSLWNLSLDQLILSLKTPIFNYSHKLIL